MGCTGSPSPGHNRLWQQQLAGVLLQPAGSKKGKAALQFLSALLAMSRQVGNERDLLTSPSVMQELWEEPFLQVSCRLGTWE